MWVQVPLRVLLINTNMLRKSLLFVFLLFVILGCSEEEEVVNNQNKEFEFLLEGNPINLSTKLNVSYFNDITVGVKEFRDDYVSLITASGTQTIEITGSSIENLTDSKVVLSPPGSGNLPYANYIGVGQLLKSNGKFYGLYHGEFHNGTIIEYNGVAGFYASVGLVTSEDGISFTPSQNPVIPNYLDQDYLTGFSDSGYGEPSMLFSKDSSNIFVYYTDHNRDREHKGVNICMGKFDVIDGEPQFDKFYFLNDQNEFTADVIRGKEVVKGFDSFSHALFPHVTFNKSLNLYVMVLSLNAFSNNGCNSNDSGIYITYSKDGINWIDPFNENVISYIGSPKKLISECSIPFSQNSSFAWHPSLIYTNESQTEGYLLYSFGESLSYPGHQLYGNKFKIDLK